MYTLFITICICKMIFNGIKLNTYKYDKWTKISYPNFKWKLLNFLNSFLYIEGEIFYEMRYKNEQCEMNNAFVYKWILMNVYSGAVDAAQCVSCG